MGIREVLVFRRSYLWVAMGLSIQVCFAAEYLVICEV